MKLEFTLRARPAQPEGSSNVAARAAGGPGPSGRCSVCEGRCPAACEAGAAPTAGHRHSQLQRSLRRAAALLGGCVAEEGQKVLGNGPGKAEAGPRGRKRSGEAEGWWPEHGGLGDFRGGKYRPPKMQGRP